MEGKEVSISNQEKSPNRKANLLQKGRLIWTNPEKFEKEAISASESQIEDVVLPKDSQSTTDATFADSLGINSDASGGKDNALSEDKQGSGGESWYELTERDIEEMSTMSDDRLRRDIERLKKERGRTSLL